MNEVIDHDEKEVIDHDEKIGEPTPSRPTRRDLIERGPEVLDKQAMKEIGVSSAAGGVIFSNVTQVMDFAKGMATSGYFIKEEFRGNVGACLGITMQAIGWRMDPFAVASKCYVVNDRIAWESQLVHAVINARAPLQHRLEVEYAGEGDGRTCTVRGMFTNGDTREYTSPPVSEIKGKSPLWKTDTDQQLWYFSVLRWARKWVPEVLLGVYTREELIQEAELGREGDDVAPGLHARLVGADRSDEGHKAGHAARELDQIAGAGQTIEHSAHDTPKTGAQGDGGEAAEPGQADGREKADKRTSGLPAGSSKRTKGVKSSKEPDTLEQTTSLTPARHLPSKAEVKRIADNAEKTGAAKLSETLEAEIKALKKASDYAPYARDWIADCKDSTELFVRWTAEKKLRNALGVTSEEREPVEILVAKRRTELEK